MKNIIRIGLGITVSLLCLYLALRNAKFADVVAMFRNVNISYLFPMTVVLIGAFILRAIRWKVLLVSVKPIAVKNLFASTMIGFMANNVLPFRAGELVRAYSIARHENIGVGSSLASLVIERLYDGMAISLFLMLVLQFMPLPAWLVQINYLLIVIYLLCAGTALFCIWYAKRVDTWIAQHRWGGLFRSVGLGLESCANIKQIVWTGILSLAHWFAIALYYYLLFLACGLSLSFLAAIVLVVVVAIGIMLPAAPGYVGNFQYSTVLGLALFAVPSDQALGYSLIAHAAQFIPVTVIGLFYFFRQSAGFSELRGERLNAGVLKNAGREQIRCG